MPPQRFYVLRLLQRYQNNCDWSAWAPCVFSPYCLLSAHHDHHSVLMNVKGHCLLFNNETWQKSFVSYLDVTPILNNFVYIPPLLCITINERMYFTAGNVHTIHVSSITLVTSDTQLQIEDLHHRCLLWDSGKSLALTVNPVSR